MKNLGIPLLHALTEGPNIPLDKPIILIGRHQECDIQIPSRKISRRHCCLAQVGEHLVVRDLGSTNGVRINGVKVQEGNLQPGDELTIGNIRYQVKWGEEADLSAGSMKNGIMAHNGGGYHRLAADDSAEIPIALPEASYSQPIPQGKPLAPRGEAGKPKDNNGSSPNHGPLLLPLDPP